MDRKSKLHRIIEHFVVVYADRIDFVERIVDLPFEEEDCDDFLYENKLVLILDEIFD